MLDPVPPCPVPPVPEVTGMCHQLCPERLCRRTVLVLPWPPPSHRVPPSCRWYPASQAHGTSRSQPCCKGRCPREGPSPGWAPPWPEVHPGGGSSALRCVPSCSSSRMSQAESCAAAGSLPARSASSLLFAELPSGASLAAAINRLFTPPLPCP